MARPEIDVHGLVKPFLRGRIHRAALIAAVPAGVYLVMRAGGAAARTAAAVYALSLVALFGASSTYHRFRGSLQWRTRLRRLDHSSIYLLIAGSYTPVCVVIVRGWPGWALLATLWTTAVVGVVMKLTRFDSSHRIGFALYLVMGWAALFTLPKLAHSVPASTLSFLIAGGVLYTVGAVVLATRFPNPFPRVFGYHEVWHLMVVIAAALHYVAFHDMLTT